MNRSHTAIVAVVILSFASSACVFIGNKAVDACPSRNFGGELLDLKKARDAGLLSAEEYQLQREKILSSIKEGKEGAKK